MKKTMYIIGAITQATDAELDLFRLAEEYYITAGYDVFNPYQKCLDKGYLSRVECLKYVLAKLVRADAVCILPTIYKSCDGQLELDIVYRMGVHEINKFD